MLLPEIIIRINWLWNILVDKLAIVISGIHSIEIIIYSFI